MGCVFVGDYLYGPLFCSVLITLETAMAALENLQARGKTVGVISHVPAMQERIGHQIRVMKE